MKKSELIRKLQESVFKNGDCEVKTGSFSDTSGKCHSIDELDISDTKEAFVIHHNG